jgi:hypothetical protein
MKKLALKNLTVKKLSNVEKANVNGGGGIRTSGPCNAASTFPVNCNTSGYCNDHSVFPVNCKSTEITAE